MNEKTNLKTIKRSKAYKQKNRLYLMYLANYIDKHNAKILDKCNHV